MMIRLMLAVLMISETSFSVSLANIVNKRIEPLRSCLDYLKNGEAGAARVFTITTPKGPQQVFCDLRSEPGSAWTLMMSYQLRYSNKDTIAPFQKPLSLSLPINEKSPNYYIYRMTLAQITNVKSHSTHWRVTCNPGWVDYYDYLRVRFADLDPLTFIGAGVCKKVEYINVRGHVGIGVTAPFWQVANKEILHHDSSSSHCSYGPSPGHVPSEDNFGFYKEVNRKFKSGVHRIFQRLPTCGSVLTFNRSFLASAIISEKRNWK